MLAFWHGHSGNLQKLMSIIESMKISSRTQADNEAEFRQDFSHYMLLANKCFTHLQTQLQVTQSLFAKSAQNTVSLNDGIQFVHSQMELEGHMSCYLMPRWETGKE